MVVFAASILDYYIEGKKYLSRQNKSIKVGNIWLTLRRPFNAKADTMHDQNGAKFSLQKLCNRRYT